MPVRKTQFVDNELYHLSLRAVGDTEIFKEQSDYYRAIFSLYEFNNSMSVSIVKRRQQRKKEKELLKKIESRSDLDQLSQGLTLTQLIVPERDMFVEILCFAVMPNHIHLLVRQLRPNGVSQFMQKFGGLATYFNKKYARKGHLFCVFRSVHIKTSEQLKNVFVYIHCNPLSIIEPGWKENGIKNAKKAIKFLENYKWSSYLDYIGIKNFSSLTQRKFLLEVMDGFVGCRQAIEDWIGHKNDICDFKEVGIE
ncbi:MAG: transposase [bacterium]